MKKKGKINIYIDRVYAAVHIPLIDDIGESTVAAPALFYSLLLFLSLRDSPTVYVCLWESGGVSII